MNQFAKTAERVDLARALPPELQQIATAVAVDLDREGQKAHGMVAVAYSGGVDSSVLAALTARAVGTERTILLMAVSESLARRERRLAQQQAEEMGLRVVEIATQELSNPEYAANPVDRCYFCKDELFTRIESDVVEQYEIDVVAYGANQDDEVRPDRPGSRAAREHEVRHPLAAAGATKADIRAIASVLGLSSAAKPAAPCLASRIPHGEPVTAQKLAAVDAAEDAVLEAGFSDCRVRHHGDIARIEIPSDEFHLIADHDRRRHLLQQVKDAGFSHATLDLGGIQSGAFTLQILSTRPGVK